MSEVKQVTGTQGASEQMRSSGPAEQAESGTWTAGIDVFREYPGGWKAGWHLNAIEFHHKVKEEAEALRDLWLAAIRRPAATDDAGDAATLRGFIKTFGSTPSMVASDRDHWKRRAEEAEAQVESARKELDIAAEEVPYGTGRNRILAVVMRLGRAHSSTKSAGEAS